jgi:hypothetical protein
MNELTVVGIKPWLPWPLTRWTWWTAPVRAERLAALRIGVAAMLLLDILGTYVYQFRDFFGPGSLGSPETFWKNQSAFLWSLLGHVEQPRLLYVALTVWIVAVTFLLLGQWARISAVVAWTLSQSFMNLNPYIHNAGDTVRTIMLFYLMLTPCAAVWSLDSRRKRRLGTLLEAPVHIYPWALRLLFLQMVLIYFFNGVNKLAGPQWRAGDSLHYVLADLTTSRISYADMPMPYFLTRLLTWTVLAWELGFAVLVTFRPTRTAALLLGIAFHIGIGLTMELGMFCLYMLCFYLPLAPWERWLPPKRSQEQAGTGQG